MDRLYTIGLLKIAVWPRGAMRQAREETGGDSHGPVTVDKSQSGQEDSLWWVGRMGV